MNQKVLIAKDYAKQKHKGQKREVSGEDYYIHCLSVFNILKGVTSDEDILIAGLLHDIIEDTDTEYTEIFNIFGVKVADLVNECTKPYETLRSREALMIKFADMLHNASEHPKEEWIKRRCKMIKESKRLK